MNQFGKSNYMTSPNTVVGVSKYTNYLNDKHVKEIIDEPDGKKLRSRYTFDETMRSGTQEPKTHKT